jgi:hypothetical protein
MKNPAVSGGGRLRLDLATSNRLRPFRRPDSGKTSWSTRIAVGAGYCLQNGKPRKSDAFPNGDGFPTLTGPPHYDVRFRSNYFGFTPKS